MIKVIFIADLSGKTGRQALAQILPELKNKYQPDFIVVNGENAAHGKGINWRSYNFIKELGVDCITSGNHIFSHSESGGILDDLYTILIRPANLADQNAPGKGYLILRKGDKALAVVNLIGSIFISQETIPFENPFVFSQKLLSKPEIQECAALIDFHGDLTSEKTALGWHLDGKVAALIGTHTHVQTNDARILPMGTGYVTDAGMTGSYNSVLGIEKEIIVKRMFLGIKDSFKIAPFPAIVNGVYLEIEGNQTKKIELIKITVPFLPL